MSHGSQNWLELWGVSRNHGFEKSEVKLKSLSRANSMETRFGSRYREARETEGSRNRDSTVFMSLNLLRLSTENCAIINKNFQTWFLTNFDVNDFCSFCSAPQKNLYWLTGIAIFASVGPLNS